MMINVLLVEHNALVREGLKCIISKNQEISLVGVARSYDETIRKAHDDNIDVILLDSSLPDGDYLDLIKRISDKTSENKQNILILSPHIEVNGALRALNLGAKGYLTIENTSDELINAINKIYHGGKFICPKLSEKLVQMALDTDKSVVAHELLSNREFQILRLLGVGMSIKEISCMLSLSSKTVSTYRSRILKKTGMKSNADLIRYAIENQI